MLNNCKSVLLLSLVLFIVGCTQVSPELAFGLLGSDSDSLTLDADIKVINLETTSSNVVFAGVCESNTNLQLSVGTGVTVKCENFKYSISIPTSVFPEGESVISIASLDNSNNQIDRKEIKIEKDLIPPTVTIAGPTASLTAATTTVPISGTCSEFGKDVQITETNSNKQMFVPCSPNGSWSTNYTIENAQQVNFNFVARHKDAAFNQTLTPPLSANKVILGAFTINGVSNSSSGYGTLLKQAFGSIYASWTSSSGASSYNVKIQKPVAATRNDVCVFTGITGTSLSKSIATDCPSLTSAQSYILVVEARDATGAFGNVQEFQFRTKAPASLQNDAGILYINSDLLNTPTAVSISHSSLILDSDSSGPFTIDVLDYGNLTSAQVVADNTSATRALTITPAAAVSGLFTIQIKITDENGVASAALPLRLAIVYPYSWAGLVDNNFNNPANFCGVAGLKTGCAGHSTAPSSSSAVMIDSLCSQPRPGTSSSGNCAPELSANTVVKILYMKANSFNQKTYNLDVGRLNEGSCYFMMTGGNFNQSTTTGDLTVYKTFQVLGGVYTAGQNAKVTLNTQLSIQGSDSFKVASNSNYVHNQSTLYLLDPQGSTGTGQYLATPADFHLHNLVIDSTAGRWRVKSSNLILDGNLTLAGVKDANNVYPKLMAFDANAKITLKGNISCTGQFGGGTLPITMSSTAGTYSSTAVGCKIPLLKLPGASSNVSEAASSTNDLIMEGLVLSGGVFSAPRTSTSGRRLIFSTTDLDTNSIVVDIASGFNSNLGEIVFETNDSSSKNYKVKMSVVNGIVFSNTNAFYSFYDIQTDFTSQYFSTSGSNSIPLRGLSRTATTYALELAAGLVADSSVLTKIKLASGASPNINVLTSNPINVSRVEINQNTSFTGVSSLNFSGSTFDLNSYSLVVPTGKSLQILTKSGTGYIAGTVVEGI